MRSELLDFIKGLIPSVWALELLVLLRKNREDGWTAQTAARELRSNSNHIAELLAKFETAGLASRVDEVYRYSPATEALENLIAELESLYHERPVSVITAIVSPRGDQLKTFADAFRFRDGPKK